MKVDIYSYIIKLTIISAIFSIISNESSRHRLIIVKDRPKLHHLLTQELISCIPEVKMLSNRVFLLPQSSDTSESSSQISTLKRLSCTESMSLEIAYGADPESLLSKIKQLRLEEIQWSIDHELLYIPSKVIQRTLSTKLLFCAISQLISGPPALCAEESISNFKVYETEIGFHFCRDPYYQFSSISMKKTWIQRPYQYSAALNFEAAISIVNLLIAKVMKRSGRSTEGSSNTFGQPLVENRLTFYDPCCGSGTTLYIAASLGLRCIGGDINSKCVEGSAANLRFALNSTVIPSDGRVFAGDNWQLRVQDATLPESFPPSTSNAEANTMNSAAFSRRTADCMLANLPWGENAFQYYNENNKLIEALGKDLKPGCECAFVVQGGYEELILVLRENGFEISDTVIVGASDSVSSGYGNERNSKGKVLDRGSKEQHDGYDGSHSSTKGFAVIFAHRL